MRWQKHHARTPSCWWNKELEELGAAHIQHMG
jgi:hypothetical protein